MQRKIVKLGSVSGLCKERSHGGGGNTMPLYAFQPTIPGESETFGIAVQAFSCQYLSRFLSCLRQYPTLVRFSKLPDSSRLR